MGSDRTRVSPVVAALPARRAGLAAVVLALLLTPAAAGEAAADIAPGGTAPTSSTPVSSGSFDTRPVARGASGAVVRMLQKSLRLAGYSVPLTGRFQSGTERAVRRFPRRPQLTAARMVDGPPPAPPPPGPPRP